MIVVEVHGEVWEKIPDFKDAICMVGEIVVIDTADGTEEYADIVDGLFIKGDMIWTGLMGQPGYFAVRADVIRIIEEAEQ